MAQDAVPSNKANSYHANGAALGAASQGRHDLSSDTGDGSRQAFIAPRLLKTPNLEHNPDSYEDLKDLEYPSAMYSAMERHLPPEFLSASRNNKLAVLQQVLARYRPNGERARIQKHREYRERIRGCYKPFHTELYTLDPERFFVQSFRDAIKDGTLEGFKRIMKEPSPGLYTFDMLQPSICAKLLEEVEYFERWAVECSIKIMRPNTMNKYGAVLDDIGMEGMLDQLMSKFLSPMASKLFNEVGGASLDSHHGFVVEYSMDRDLELGFHVDDSEVTLNVCLGKEFTGGDLFFRGVRCDKHVNGEVHPEEIFEYPHVPGRAILHAGRHRHGAKAITSGQRTNLILWCRSSVFRELKKYQSEFSGWCGECHARKKDRRRHLSADPKRSVAN
ncbi:hypothetical protein KP509_02G074300 [Ceratopteris richardii]|uniref:Fe2OG dioxygenase domain-containing protein n=1 Tax=Ceratopteris richardii TaxID=49495 RepID=A0A8T2V7C5_CERRI|nr:hypothetical protein KP509_02G074300 [Ceratopteris richardii]